MIRKDFIKLTALTGGVMATSGLLKGLSPSLTNSAGSITAADLQRFLISLVKLEPKTVDRFIIGDPETRINKIGTCWMPYWDTCRKGRSGRCKCVGYP